MMKNMQQPTGQYKTVSPVVPINPYSGFTSGQCYEDNSNRILPFWVLGQGNADTYDGSLSKERCISACAGYDYAGVQYGHECFCGNEKPSEQGSKSSVCIVLINQSQYEILL